MKQETIAFRIHVCFVMCSFFVMNGKGWGIDILIWKNQLENIDAFRYWRWKWAPKSQTNGILVFLYESLNNPEHWYDARQVQNIIGKTRWLLAPFHNFTNFHWFENKATNRKDRKQKKTTEEKTNCRRNSVRHTFNSKSTKISIKKKKEQKKITRKNCLTNFANCFQICYVFFGCDFVDSMVMVFEHRHQYLVPICSRIWRLFLSACSHN